MANLANGFYSVIQYCPDRSRMETANVGVLLFCPSLGYIDTRMSAGNDRARRLFGSRTINIQSLDSAKRSIRNRVRVSSSGFKTLDDLNALVQSRANEIILTPPRPTKVLADNPELTLANLFKELVGGRSPKQRDLAKKFPELDKAFDRPELRGKVQFNREVTVPVVGKRLKAPYAFVNGALNLVLPETFGDSDASATNHALRLAAEGELLQKHSPEPAHLIIASRFSGGGDLKHRILNVFDRFDVRAFDVQDAEEVRRLTEEIAREAH